MVNRKQALRLGTFLAILMFLLVPLLSSPVAAAFTDNTNVTTDMTPAGPTIVINPTNNRVHFYDGLAPTATFTLTYSFSDTDPTGLGSWHTATITVTPPGAPTGFASTGALFCPPGVSPPAVWTGVLSVGPLTHPVPPGPTVWTVTIFVSVLDVANNNLVTSSATFTVTVV